MKKVLSMVSTLVLLLAFSGAALTEGAGTIPGTDFPMPDELTQVKAVSVEMTEFTEDFMKELVGGDFVVVVSFDSQKSAAQAREEYEAGIVKLYPDMTDSAGNLLKVEDGAVKTDFRLVVKRGGETGAASTVAGEEAIGWFDFAAYAGALTGVSHSEQEHMVTVGTKDGKASVSLWPIGYGGKDADFESTVSVELIHRYDEGAGIYRNVERTDMELDGVPACRVTFEMSDPFNETETFLGAAYLMTNAAGEYVRASVLARAEMEDPAFSELVQMFESTYTRTQPQ